MEEVNEKEKVGGTSTDDRDLEKSTEVAKIDPLNLLTRDVFYDHVLSFCHRLDIVELMKIPPMCQQFGLRDSYCDNHGTPFDFLADELPCVDCRMHAQGNRRCDKCNTFHPGRNLVTSVCNQSLCRTCRAACDRCGGTYHLDCSDCGIVGYCDYCNKTFCESCRATSLCDSCGVVRACHGRNCEYEIYRCNICSKSICSLCRETQLTSCNRCNVSRCSECYPLSTCSGCQRSSCQPCGQKASVACDFCGISACHYKNCDYSVWECATCSKPYGYKCSCHGDKDELNFCSVCKKTHCAGCMSFLTCSSCNNATCESCTITCNICSVIWCLNCCGASQCGVCGLGYCLTCRELGFCDGCTDFYCDSCRTVEACSCGTISQCVPSCPDVSDFDVCTKCGRRCCECCYTVASCHRCGKGYCYDECLEDELDFECKLCGDVLCKECSQQPLPNCKSCDKHLCSGPTCTKCGDLSCYSCSTRSNDAWVCRVCASEDAAEDKVESAISE